MKKALALLLALVMCLSLVACGGGNESTENPYEKYAKYEELFVYLEAGDWENVNAYIQNHFGSTENDSVIEETLPSETATPETTVTEPVYETIEITADNLWDYFEIEESARYEEDAFGDLSFIMVEWAFNLKPEYRGKLQLENTDFAVKLEYNFWDCAVNLDWENRTYELIPQPSEERTYTLTVGIQDDYYGQQFIRYGDGKGINNRQIFSDTTRTDAVPTDASSYTILRIEGYITLLKED